ncbi:TRAFs-binding domain-containing protein [Pengzhenrongella phosphoraccumulans]|uniref:TRAFs-binding domain-containing protein n=1 Tax=Pengzhenrongella phosphoraccumulans TaxID=3114394 RepID=UPI00388D4B29
MPFHAASDSDGQRIDFAAVYGQLIVPAVENAGMSPIRADEDLTGGIFHKTMFERLVLCEFAVADLSTGNPNVYYELGVRHGLRPYSTVPLFRKGWRLPLDVAPISALEYPVDHCGVPIDVEATIGHLTARLLTAREAKTDSPVHQLVTGLPVAEVDHERIDTFREHAERSEELRRLLDEAAEHGTSAIRAVEGELGEPRDFDTSTALSLLLAYRSVSSWPEMVHLVEGLSRPLRTTTIVQEQYAFALNRNKQDMEAERVLQAALRERPSSETYGLLGSVYKGRWERETSIERRRGLLALAINAYLRGFEMDWRDPYPGVNAVTLMSLATPADPRLRDLLPVVRFAADRRLSAPKHDPDYWDHATDLGLAVLTGDQERAQRALERALAVARDDFEPKTTASDLGHIAEAMRRRDEDATWVDELIEALAATSRR